MDSMLLRVFQGQLLYQCEFMLLAAKEANKTMKQRSDPDVGALETTTRIFYSIQNLLNAAANISKALWGQGGRLEAKRKPLRDSIGITDSSPFREVAMRNNFEHFDERLDDWWGKSTPRNRRNRHVPLVRSRHNGGEILGTDVQHAGPR